MNKYFICFADYKLSRTQERIRKQVENTKIFDHIICYNPNDFDSEFLEKNGKFIQNNPRGYGYWIWKPYIVLHTLKKMNENDILLYMDSGCTFRNHPRFQEYINFVTESKQGILSFCLKENIEKRWTKMDVFVELQCEEDKYKNTPQICATAFLLKKCNYSIDVMNQWYENCCKHHLINDDINLKNESCFIENRHDQSLFSLTLKKNGIHFLTEDYEFGHNFPFHDTRLKF
jgi:hypothetical protein